MNLQKLKKDWVDEPSYHSMIHDLFCSEVSNNELLNWHRTWVKQNAFGFGEDSFHWFWVLLLNEMPNEFSFCEVGVFRFQVVSLIKMIATYTAKKDHRYCVTPLDTSDNHWESDYRKDGEIIHDEFKLPKDYTIYHGLSADESIIERTKSTAPYDILYLDGGHTYEVITSDLKHYPNMVKVGGYLVVDDACNDLNMPFGFFQGIEPVTRAVLEWENHNFEFQFNVVHLRVYKRVS